MSDLEAAEREWQDWIRDACTSVGVDPDLVDVPGVHALTRDIAHGFSRPMAPVGAFIWGVALGQATANAGPARAAAGGGDHADGDGPVGAADALRAAIAATAEAAATGSAG